MVCSVLIYVYEGQDCDIQCKPTMKLRIRTLNSWYMLLLGARTFSIPKLRSYLMCFLRAGSPRPYQTPLTIGYYKLQIRLGTL